MNLTINPGAATDDAQQIDSIVSNIKDDMEKLSTVIKEVIPEGVQTEWSENLKNDWDKYYTADIPEAMENMKLSATNLRAAVDEAIKYSQSN